uniref:Uncharacterized protein n=1 Tax=Physcomitrium patens TaxID=3218 RepID=A0A2K1JRQ6_PHYPA|nr:hypothetical protein PHYPA_016599 [Physcomitrium patens]
MRIYLSIYLYIYLYMLCACFCVLKALDDTIANLVFGINANGHACDFNSFYELNSLMLIMEGLKWAFWTWISF